MIRTNEEKIYALITALEGFVSDMRWTMQNVDRSDPDGIFDTKHDLGIRIGSCESKLAELKKEIKQC